MSLWVGVDVGGTFTDLVAVDEAGRVETRKVLSTPSDQSDGVIDALRALGRPDVGRLVHGTTIATNMLLERKGARVALCLTAGFTDLLYLRRQNRASLYDLAATYPEPLAGRELTIAVPERIEPQGITRPLTATSCAAIAEQIAAMKPEVVAVVLLHSYRDSSHERMLADALAIRLPDVGVTLSSAVFPEVREYERAATTVAEAYLRPGVSRYLRSLQFRLTNRPTDRPGAIGVMTSSGGMRSLDEAAVSAAQLALSGPAGGVVGAAAIARALKLDRALTIDIGGTSADVGLILDGEPLVEPGGSVADVPLALPRVLVETVSAGGGSVAWVDEGGALRVGPRSAGALPGPVAFGRGGLQPTVTDAHITLRRISEARIAGGIELDVEGARASIEGLADRLDETATRTARAIIDTADAAMARALRRVSVERGIDPRTCVLIAFGGGGPLHGCGLADMLGITTVVVPPHAGALSAFGLAMAPERREVMASVMRSLDAWSGRERAQLVTELGSRLDQQHPAEDNERKRGERTDHVWLARMRYAGQGHELDVPIEPTHTNEVLRSTFAALHQRRYGFTLTNPVEVVGVRHVVTRAGRQATLRRPDRLQPKRVRGPASVALPDATMFVAPGWAGRRAPIDGWILERK